MEEAMNALEALIGAAQKVKEGLRKGTVDAKAVLNRAPNFTHRLESLIDSHQNLKATPATVAVGTPLSSADPEDLSWAV